jgi:hypothetical protein
LTSNPGGRIPDDAVVKAVHIEVDGEHRNEAKHALEIIYNADATVWPLHLRLRAVPLFKEDVMNSQGVKDGIKRLLVAKILSIMKTLVRRRFIHGRSKNLILKRLHLEKRSGI